MPPALPVGLRAPSPGTFLGSQGVAASRAPRAPSQIHELDVEPDAALRWRKLPAFLTEPFASTGGRDPRVLVAIGSAVLSVVVTLAIVGGLLLSLHSPEPLPAAARAGALPVAASAAMQAAPVKASGARAQL
jgi:hypothetical protein